MRERESKAGFVGLALLAGTTWLVRSVAELVGGVAVFLVAGHSHQGRRAVLRGERLVSG